MQFVYKSLGWVLPTRPVDTSPRRIVLIRPCCIGDVVLATAALRALRRRYPEAQVTWAVGSWSARAVADHPDADALLDLGPAANPARTPRGLLRVVRQLRGGEFDMAVSLVRSPLMGLAVLLSGIPVRVGLDSAGRGFGYTLRVPVDPAHVRHEAEIYLDVIRALGGDTTGCIANVPVTAQAQESVNDWLATKGISQEYVVLNPAGGSNPGMVLDAKRWPPENFAVLADRLADALGVQVVLVAGPDDRALLQKVADSLRTPAPISAGVLDFQQIAALAAGAKGYVGNDTGMTHLAAAAGAPTVMIFGPSDPARYGPFTPNSTALWKPTALASEGVAASTPESWDWARDGIDLETVVTRTLDFLR